MSESARGDVGSTRHAQLLDWAIVLAGGAGRRMGSDKRFLRLGDDTLLARAVRSLRRVFRRVGVSVSRGDAAQLDAIRSTLPAEIRATTPLFEDSRDDAGPVEGVRASLTAMTDERAFFVAVDIPIVPIAVVQLLWQRAGEAGVRGAVPRWSGRLEPAFAVYSRQVLSRLDRALEGGRRDLRQVADWQGVAVVDLEDPMYADRLEGVDRQRLFWNVNEPDDYDRLVEAFARGEVQEDAVV